MLENSDYGILLQPNPNLQRSYFSEMVKLMGIQAKYFEPVRKQWNDQGELESDYKLPIKVGCIFQDHLDNKTAKKLGWDAELTESAAIIHVPYDLSGLQIGALFEIPSAFDNTPGRKFRVTKMSTIMVYPASISCEIVPEWENTAERAEIELFNNTNFNVLNEG